MFAKIRAFLVSFWNAAAESQITKGLGAWNDDNNLADGPNSPAGELKAEFFPEPDAEPPF